MMLCVLSDAWSKRGNKIILNCLCAFSGGEGGINLPLSQPKSINGKTICGGVTSCVTRLVTLILCMLGVYIATP